MHWHLQHISSWTGIVMGSMSYVEIAICDNRDNCTIVLHAMWKARRANIERLMLSTVPPIQDLNVELVKVLGYKWVRSVFLCIYFKIKWMNRSIKVLSIAAYYFFPSLRQFSNSISRKNDSSLKTIQFWSQFSISAKEVNRWLAKSCCILRNNQ